MLGHLTQQGVTGRLSWSWWTVASPRPLPARSAGTTTSCARSGATTSSRCSAPSGTLGASSCPRPPRTLPPSCEVVREHHHLGDRLAPGRLHRDHPAPPVTGTCSACAPAP